MALRLDAILRPQDDGLLVRPARSDRLKGAHHVLQREVAHPVSVLRPPSGSPAIVLDPQDVVQAGGRDPVLLASVMLLMYVASSGSFWVRMTRPATRSSHRYAGYSPSLLRRT